MSSSELSTNITTEEAATEPEEDQSSQNVVEEELDNNSPKYKFALIDLEKMRDLVPGMNYIETVRMKNRINQEYESFKGAKNLLDAISNMNNIDDTNRKVLQANIMNDTEYKNDSENFLKEYDSNIERFDTLIAILDENIKRFESVEKTSKFLNSQMVDTIRKRKEEVLSRGVSNDNTLVKYLDTVTYVYEHRDSLDYIMRKASFDYIVNKYRKEIKNKRKDAIRKARKEFLGIFKESQLVIFEKRLIALFNNDDAAATLFEYHLFRICTAERGTGDYNWVKAVIMNILDIESGIYDLDTPAEEYYSKISSLYNIYKY